jgi:hypothetical protein
MSFQILDSIRANTTNYTVCLLILLFLFSPTDSLKGHSSKFWNEEGNRKFFFEEVAFKLGFDALVPENWYKLTKSQICEEKVSFSFIYLVSTCNFSLNGE